MFESSTQEVPIVPSFDMGMSKTNASSVALTIAPSTEALVAREHSTINFSHKLMICGGDMARYGELNEGKDIKFSCFAARGQAVPPRHEATKQDNSTSSEQTQVPKAASTVSSGYYHPLGCMFYPELDRCGVISLVSDIFCRPGYTTGPSDERRVLRQVRSGRIDIKTMSRLLRWFHREHASHELRKRGLRFVGPKSNVQPYTTGAGISGLLREVSLTVGQSAKIKHGHAWNACPHMALLSATAHRGTCLSRV